MKSQSLPLFNEQKKGYTKTCKGLFKSNFKRAHVFSKMMRTARLGIISKEFYQTQIHFV